MINGPDGWQVSARTLGFGRGNRAPLRHLRPIGTPALSRLPVVLFLSLLVGCTSDPARGRGFSPPGGGNETYLHYSFVATNSGINCALVNVAAAMCWGNGTLGDGVTTESDRPVRVGGAIPLQTLTNASGYVCGLSSGTAYCWGINVRGNLGDGTREQRLTPVLVDTDVVFRTISANGIHTCGVSVDDLGYCWGWNNSGQLGIGSTEPVDSVRLVPAPVAGGLRFRAIETGFRNTCGLTTDGEPHCWGEHWGPTPVAVPTTPSFESISMGGDSTCGLTAEGEAYCWGSNSDGQFGNGEWEDWRLESYHEVPVQVVTELRFSALSGQ